MVLYADAGGTTTGINAKKSAAQIAAEAATTTATNAVNPTLTPPTVPSTPGSFRVAEERSMVGLGPVAQATKTAADKAAADAAAAAQIKATTARAIFEMQLRELGIPTDLIQSSISYLEALDDAGIKDPTQLLNIYMNNKTFTTKSGTVLTSPFYTRFTSLVDGLTDPSTGRPYTGKDAFAWRTGMEAKISQYGFSDLFKTDSSLQKLAKNGVSVDDFETRMQQAKLAEASADPSKVAALQKLGFIGANGGVKDFYLNAEIGQKQFEENQRVGAFATENIRFAGQGVGFNEARIRQISAMYGNQTEAQALASANKLYAGVAENLQQTVALSGMYDRTGETATEAAPGIQTQLENEILTATPSDTRKRVSEANQRAFQGKAGVGQGALGNRSVTGLI